MVKMPYRVSSLLKVLKTHFKPNMLEMVETELMASMDQLNDGGYIFEKLGVRPMRPLTLTVARDLVLLTFMMGARESSKLLLSESKTRRYYE